MDFFARVLSANGRTLIREREKAAEEADKVFQANLDHIESLIRQDHNDSIYDLIDMIYESSFPEEQMFMKHPSLERLRTNQQVIVRLLSGLSAQGVPGIELLCGTVEKQGVEAIAASIITLLNLLSPLLTSKGSPTFTTDDLLNAIDFEWHSSSKSASPLLHVLSSKANSPAWVSISPKLDSPSRFRIFDAARNSFVERLVPKLSAIVNPSKMSTSQAGDQVNGLLQTERPSSSYDNLKPSEPKPYSALTSTAGAAPTADNRFEVGPQYQVPCSETYPSVEGNTSTALYEATQDAEEGIDEHTQDDRGDNYSDSEDSMSSCCSADSSKQFSPSSASSSVSVHPAVVEDHCHLKSGNFFSITENDSFQTAEDMPEFGSNKVVTCPTRQTLETQGSDSESMDGNSSFQLNLPVASDSYRIADFVPEISSTRFNQDSSFMEATGANLPEETDPSVSSSSYCAKTSENSSLSVDSFQRNPCPNLSPESETSYINKEAETGFQPSDVDNLVYENRESEMNDDIIELSSTKLNESCSFEEARDAILAAESNPCVSSNSDCTEMSRQASISIDSFQSNPYLNLSQEPDTSLQTSDGNILVSGNKESEMKDHKLVAEEKDQKLVREDSKILIPIEISGVFSNSLHGEEDECLIFKDKEERGITNIEDVLRSCIVNASGSRESSLGKINEEEGSCIGFYSTLEKLLEPNLCLDQQACKDMSPLNGIKDDELEVVRIQNKELSVTSLSILLPSTHKEGGDGIECKAYDFQPAGEEHVESPKADKDDGVERTVREQTQELSSKERRTHEDTVDIESKTYEDQQDCASPKLRKDDDGLEETEASGSPNEELEETDTQPKEISCDGRTHVICSNENLSSLARTYEDDDCTLGCKSVDYQQAFAIPKTENEVKELVGVTPEELVNSEEMISTCSLKADLSVLDDDDARQQPGLGMQLEDNNIPLPSLSILKESCQLEARAYQGGDDAASKCVKDEQLEEQVRAQQGQPQGVFATASKEVDSCVLSIHHEIGDDELQEPMQSGLQMKGEDNCYSEQTLSVLQVCEYGGEPPTEEDRLQGENVSYEDNFITSVKASLSESAPMAPDDEKQDPKQIVSVSQLCENCGATIRSVRSKKDDDLEKTVNIQPRELTSYEETSCQEESLPIPQLCEDVKYKESPKAKKDHEQQTEELICKTHEEESRSTCGERLLMVDESYRVHISGEFSEEKSRKHKGKINKMKGLLRSISLPFLRSPSSKKRTSALHKEFRGLAFFSCLKSPSTLDF